MLKFDVKNITINNNKKHWTVQINFQFNYFPHSFLGIKLLKYISVPSICGTFDHHFDDQPKFKQFFLKLVNSKAVTNIIILYIQLKSLIYLVYFSRKF